MKISRLEAAIHLGLIGLMMAVLIAIGLAAPSHADPAADDRFLNMLENAGLVPENRDAAINHAHVICGNLWSGTETFDDQVSAVLAVEQGLSDKLARTVVAISIEAYCPDISARRKVQ